MDKLEQFYVSFIYMSIVRTIESLSVFKSVVKVFKLFVNVTF